MGHQVVPGWRRSTQIEAISSVLFAFIRPQSDQLSMFNLNECAFAFSIYFDSRSFHSFNIRMSNFNYADAKLRYVHFNEFHRQNVSVFVCKGHSHMTLEFQPIQKQNPFRA